MIYLNADDVVTLHAAILAQLGDEPPPLGREDALMSALVRPQQAAHYEQADLFHQAATLAAGVAKSHAFVDGNKRTAIHAMAMFLGMNSAIRFSDADTAFAAQFIDWTGLPIDHLVEEIESYLRQHYGSDPP